MCFVVGSEPFASVLVDRPSCSQRCPAPRIDPGLRAFVGPRAAIDSCPSARSAGENLRFVRRCVVGSERLASFKSCVTTGPLAAASPLSAPWQHSPAPAERERKFQVCRGHRPAARAAQAQPCLLAVMTHCRGSPAAAEGSGIYPQPLVTPGPVPGPRLSRQKSRQQDVEAPW